ncbi:MAG TPA: molybdopterin-dependent oxidoreductase [Candidatus Accumulibacter phosphatis]|uniref:nitrate reductase n=1 Tax=Accumulibacter sp. TaxID=2053492 RepID=UPI002589130D|nr:nitrate reductase [Accumulibacter sp.]HRF12295.1 molybdopterin-dependent oxidoreductase [Candidatus Accumulibacter phosphatis]
MNQQIKSTCCYCGVGCGLLIESADGQIVGVRGDPEHPANLGRLCSKGATLHLTARPDYRLLHPELRLDRSQPRQRVGWEAALDHAAGRFAEIIRAHGPDSVAFYVSGQLLTEDYYVFNKLAKGLIGTNNIDTNSRLCMSSAVAGYKQTLGADAPPCCYEDIALADCLLIAGANPAVAHPIVFRRIEDARAAHPELRIIVIDPRRSETAALADLHLALKPGTDIALYNGLLNVLLGEQLVDRDYIALHTEGFDALEAIVAAYPPAAVAEICGLAETDIIQAARWFGTAGAALSLYCQGLNQSSHGTHNNAALIHLHLATGQIGRPGAGPFSLTGQPNAMGGREVGGLANLLSAHRDLANSKHRDEVASLWGVPSVPAAPGRTAIELFAGLKRGVVKAVWIACTNPAQSLPDQAEVRAALQAADFVVLQEAYANTDTAAYADLLLPATTWGEKEGTVTNSERCITHLTPALAPPGEARHDWQIAVDFARRLGARLDQPLTGKLFPYADAEAIFNEHRESTRGRDLDITGLSYALLDAAGPQQWPMPEGASRGRQRLYEDGVFATPGGRARFVQVEHQPTAESTDAARPLSLLSGRLRDQWHGMSRTGSVARLFNLDDEPLLSMHPDDLQQRGLVAGDLAQVDSARGDIVVRVKSDAGLNRGSAWLPMHWGSQFMNSAGVNALTTSARDPYSHQPELKHAAVAVNKAELPWQLVILRKAGVGELAALALLARARTLLGEFAFASVGLYGRDEPLVIFRAAHPQALPESRLQEIDSLFGLGDEAAAIVYVDQRRQISKRALAPEGKLIGVRLAGETQAEVWLKEVMADDTLDAELIRWAVAPIGKRPGKLPVRSRVVCKCADVTAAQIATDIASGATLAVLQEQRKCGTFCGSCLPELRQMISDQAQHASDAAVL